MYFNQYIYALQQKSSSKASSSLHLFHLPPEKSKSINFSHEELYIFGFSYSIFPMLYHRQIYWECKYWAIKWVNFFLAFYIFLIIFLMLVENKLPFHCQENITADLFQVIRKTCFSIFSFLCLKNITKQIWLGAKSPIQLFYSYLYLLKIASQYTRNKIKDTLHKKWDLSEQQTVITDYKKFRVQRISQIELFLQNLFIESMHIHISCQPHPPPPPPEKFRSNNFAK